MLDGERTYPTSFHEGMPASLGEVLEDYERCLDKIGAHSSAVEFLQMAYAAMESTRVHGLREKELQVHLEKKGRRRLLGWFR
jgi:hypothetical protein